MPDQQDASTGSYAAARRALLYGFAGFWTSVAVCVAIVHDATVEHDGLSYFSVRATTLPVIALGYASVVAGMLVAAHRLPDDGIGRRLALPMRCMPAFVVALLCTPFNKGTALNWTHMTFGVTLAISQAAVSVWLCTVLPAVRVLTAASVQLLGGLVAALSLPATSFNYLFQGELLTNLGFCACLIAAVGAAAHQQGDGAPLRGTLAPD
jgi:hypothetical protein